jgi:hypothetical protein
VSKIIIKTVEELRQSIELNGYEINETKELVGVVLPTLKVHEMELLEEENAIRDYYTMIGINTQVVRSLEHNLYEFIFRGIKQSVEQLFYFDRTQDYTSRRFVFSTTDCISHLQFLYRRGTATLFAHIRSTDVVKLLPWDILFLCKLSKRILLECEFPEVREIDVIIVVASAHYYLKPDTMY